MKTLINNLQNWLDNDFKNKYWQLMNDTMANK